MTIHEQDKAKGMPDEAPSKSELKRQMLALQALGEQLVELPEMQLKQIPMPETLFDAVARARRITKHGGLRRELQFIGKLMRNIEVAPIQEALSQLESGHQEDVAELHECETWREQLINHDSALTEFISKYPDTNVQQLRQLLRKYSLAKNEQQKVTVYRQIFKYIRTMICD